MFAGVDGPFFVIFLYVLFRPGGEFALLFKEGLFVPTDGVFLKNF